MSNALRFLTPEDRHLLLEKARRAAFRRGERIVEEGASTRAIYIIRKGSVRVEQDRAGQRVEIDRMDAGEFFGEMSFLEGTGASATVVADDDVEVDVIDGPDVQHLLDTHHAFAARFYRSLAVALSQRLWLANAR
jgi:CRP-like cAMP-binding protein